ncbi:Chemotaxis protein CheC -- inhibitor of MCP methylation [hydrothermal vent metagenome]|uniref:Chemotaxis protein CheC -- inhibitor of MCP methylation n=1 Tax=hydrothermal vent metagenome TaxID=652676 RepID=A0A3B1BAX8_9ZZZZ
MTTQVLICDDSSFARKQLARSLPEDWDINVNYAVDGADAIFHLHIGKGNVLFLDLNMPVMDGYEVLKSIKFNKFETVVIVVSGDIQPEAAQRVKDLGAIAFLKKPTNVDKISEVLKQFGLFSTTSNKTKHSDIEVNELDMIGEVANVAMGRAADLLAKLLGHFIKMPIPNVNMLEVSELRMALNQIDHDAELSAVCQGFIGSGIAGEALLIFNDSSYTDIAKLIKYDDQLDEAAKVEMLMDISNIMIGACLNGIADQLDLNFSQGYPVVLGRHVKIEALLNKNTLTWKKILTIEMGFTIEDCKVNADLLLVFTEDSLISLKQIAEYLEA